MSPESSPSLPALALRALRRALITAAALVSPGIAMAQDASARESDPIVVVGTRDDEQAISDFVDALLPTPSGGQLSRFRWAICPAAAGMAPAQRAAVADRIRAVARAAQVPVGDAGCAANLLVVVTSDRPAFLRLLARRHPDYFSALSPGEHRRLHRSTEPAIAWQLAGPPVDADGYELSFDPALGGYVNRTSRRGSRIGNPVYPQFAAAIIVIDSAALDGLTTTQIADYAAMRTLLGADPARAARSSIPTILDILGAPMGSEVPLTLTDYDLGLLRAFYATDPSQNAAAQRAQIRQELQGTDQPAEQRGN